MIPIVQTLEHFHAPHFGRVTYLKVYMSDYQPLSWTEIWQAIHDVYPNHWEIQLFPPTHDLINDAAVYHLWLLSAEWVPPPQMNLAHRLMPKTAVNRPVLYIIYMERPFLSTCCLRCSLPAALPVRLWALTRRGRQRIYQLQTAVCPNDCLDEQQRPFAYLQGELSHVSKNDYRWQLRS